MTPYFVKLLAHWDAGDMSAAMQQMAAIVDVIAVIDRYGGLKAHRAILCMLGRDLGQCRLPLDASTAVEQENMKDELTSLGYFAIMKACEE
jgi:N-acetylneuraminate lyase